MLHITMVDIWRPFTNSEFYNPVIFPFTASLVVLWCVRFTNYTSMLKIRYPPPQ